MSYNFCLKKKKASKIKESKRRTIAKLCSKSSDQKAMNHNN